MLSSVYLSEQESWGEKVAVFTKTCGWLVGRGP